jgi:hypothetical protein
VTAVPGGLLVAGPAVIFVLVRLLIAAFIAALPLVERALLLVVSNDLAPRA